MMYINLDMTSLPITAIWEHAFYFWFQFWKNVIHSDNFLQLSEAVDAAKQELLIEKEISEKSQKELEKDLVATKHRYAIGLRSLLWKRETLCYV